MPQDKLTAARRAFLHTLADFMHDGMVHSYVEEKIAYIFRATRVEEVRGILDLQRQRRFDGWLRSIEQEEPGTSVLVTPCGALALVPATEAPDVTAARNAADAASRSEEWDARSNGGMY